MLRYIRRGWGFFLYFSTSLRSVISTISILCPRKSQRAWTSSSICMHCFLADCSAKAEHLNIPFWLCTKSIHITELGTVRGTSASGSSESGAAHKCWEQRIPLARAGHSPAAPEQGWRRGEQPAAPDEARERVRSRESRQEEQEVGLQTKSPTADVEPTGTAEGRAGHGHNASLPTFVGLQHGADWHRAPVSLLRALQDLSACHL